MKCYGCKYWYDCEHFGAGEIACQKFESTPKTKVVYSSTGTDKPAPEFTLAGFAKMLEDCEYV